MAGDFGAYSKRSEAETEMGYLVDHTTLVYLIDEEGRLRFLFRNDHSPKMMAAIIRKALSG